MANPNGIGAQNAAMYSGMNGSIMPSAGHYSDMQTLMQNMESLSGWLEQNRQEWSQVQEGIARVERLQVGTSLHKSILWISWCKSMLETVQIVGEDMDPCLSLLGGGNITPSLYLICCASLCLSLSLHSTSPQGRLTSNGSLPQINGDAQGELSPDMPYTRTL